MPIAPGPHHRIAVPIVSAAAALAIGAVAERAARSGDVWGPGLVALDAAVGVVTVLAGLWAWLARPESRVGPALVGIGALWFPGAFGYGRDMAMVDLVGFPLQGWHDILLVALLVSLTPGGLRTRAARIIVAGGLVGHLGLSLARLLLRPPLDPTTCFCIGNRITGITELGAYEAAVRVASVAEGAFALAALVLIAMRWRRASGPARRSVGWLLAAGSLTVAVVTYNRIATRVLGTPAPAGDTAVVVLAILRMAIPVTIVASLLRGRGARSRVADVVVSLDGAGVEAGARVLQRALGDPEVRLLRWSAEQDAYLDGSGAPVTLPPADAPTTATILNRNGTPLGAIVHDAALLHEPELLAAVASAARMALDNERLAEEVRARLDEVRASRHRIVEATDAERRRLEQDLHDGAQQRLVALSVRLRSLERRLSETGNVSAADEIDRSADELNETIRDIRELVRGIRPPVLAEAGLPGALASLADRAPIQVAVDARLDTRPPEVTESALYFVANEALTNVLKHASAASVRIDLREDGRDVVLSVSDDGAGGATFGGGLTGLRDRMEALGGTLSLTTHPTGTTIEARVPTGARGVQSADARR